MLEPPSLLTAVEYRKTMSGGKSAPRLVDAVDDDGNRVKVVLKLRDPGTPIRDGAHFKGTSLACELICAVIARAIGLPVPDYYIVEVTESFALSVTDTETQALLIRNLGENFGSKYHRSYALWQTTHKAQSSKLLSQFEETITFDSAVFNGDRGGGKPNLLYRGDSVLLIDHSLALTAHEWNKSLVKRSPLFGPMDIRRHCTAASLQGKQKDYESVPNKWEGRLTDKELNDLRDMIPDSWERTSGDLDKIFSFLKNRPQRFVDITKQLTNVLS